MLQEEQYNQMNGQWMKDEMTGVTSIDLFCGAGGLFMVSPKKGCVLWRVLT